VTGWPRLSWTTTLTRTRPVSARKTGAWCAGGGFCADPAEAAAHTNSISARAWRTGYSNQGRAGGGKNIRNGRRGPGTWGQKIRSVPAPGPWSPAP